MLVFVLSLYLYENLDSPNKMSSRLGCINFRDIAVLTVYLPFFCLIGCVSYAIIFYFDEVTEPKCGVHNFIPSIGGAVCMRPLLHLWRFCIVVHAVPRICITHLYYRSHISVASKVVSWQFYESVVSLVYFLDLVDIFSLCGLTIVSTVDNFRKVISFYSFRRPRIVFHFIWAFEPILHGTKALLTYPSLSSKIIASYSKCCFL